MNIIRHYRNLVIDIIFLALVSCIPIVWFPPGYMITGNDAGYPINISVAYANRFFTWNSADTFGQDTSMNMGTLPIHTVEAAFHAAGLSLYGAQRASFIFWFFGMLLSMYVFIVAMKKYAPFRFAPLIGSLLYGVNFYLLELWKYGAGTTFSAYIALPLVMLFLLKLYLSEITPYQSAVGMSLVLFIFNAGAGFSIPLYGGLLVAVLVAVIYFGAFSAGKDFLRFLRRTFATGVLFAVFSSLLNAYWILPFADYVRSNFTSDVALHGGAAGILSWTDSVSKFTSALNLFRLQGFPDWYDTVPPRFATVITGNPFFMFVSLLFAPLAYAAMFAAKKMTDKKIIGYFVLVSLIGIFFSAGTHAPTGSLFAQIMLHVPGFSIFRSAQYKFIPSLYFSFAFLVSYVLGLGIERLPEIRIAFAGKNRIQWLLAGLLVVFFVYHYPYFGNELFVWNKPLTTQLKVPDYVIEFGEWSKSHLPPEERFLVMPRLNDMWRSEVFTWGYSSLYSLYNLVGLKPFVENTNVENNAQIALTTRLYSEILTNGSLVGELASTLGTTRALLRNDAYFDLPWNRSDRPDTYANALASGSAYQPLWQSGKWTMYALPAVWPGKITALSKLALFTGPAASAVAPYLVHAGAFVQEEYHSPKPFPLTFAPVISTATCVSCTFDEQLNSPEILPPRVLPGSFLYFLKSFRERSMEDPHLPAATLLTNRLGLSLTRAEEAATLIDLKRDTSLVLATTDRLRDNWKYIGESFAAIDKANPDFSLVKQIETYAASQKGLLIHSEGITKERVIQVALSDITHSLDAILATIADYRKYWTDRKMYAIPEGVSRGMLYTDAKRIPKSDGVALVVPEVMTMGGVRTPLRGSLSGEAYSFGDMDFRGNTRVVFEYPKRPNLVTNLRFRAVSTPKGVVTCQIGDVAHFDPEQSYVITVSLDRLLSNESVMYLKRIKNDRENDGLEETLLVIPDVTFNLRTSTLLPQTFSFSGESADIGASVYLCAPSVAAVETTPTDISVTQKIANDFFIASPGEATGAGVQTAVRYRRIDQTKYAIDTEGMVFPTVIMFNENFNPKWKLYALPGAHRDGIAGVTDTWRVPPQPENTHFTVNGFANAWYVGAKPAGDLVIEFSSQKLFYQGIVASLAGALIVLATLFIRWLIRKRK